MTVTPGELQVLYPRMTEVSRIQYIEQHTSQMNAMMAQNLHEKLTEERQKTVNEPSAASEENPTKKEKSEEDKHQARLKHSQRPKGRYFDFMI